LNIENIINQLTDKQERLLYIRAINGSKVTPEIKECCMEYLEFEENYDCYGWTWDVDKLSNLPIIMLRGLYWGIHCDEL
jgi:hypothetical protein